MIKPNAASNEKTSPFYIANERFCRDFENFIAEKEGISTGNYNAWSYTVYGKITSPQTWILKYKKATYSGAHSFLTSKYQNLLTLAEWKTEKASYDSGFLIRRKTLNDRFMIMFSPSYRRLEVSKRYVLISKAKKARSILNLTNRLAPLLRSGEVYKIQNKKNVLTIELRTDTHHFDIFNEVSQL